MAPIQSITSTIVFLSVSLSCFGQTQPLSGVAYKAGTREPIPFVTIGVLHTPNGTVTNVNGVFSISVKETDTLVFSSVGYKKLTVRVDFSDTNIFLEEEITALEEVKVIAHRKREKNSLGDAKAKTIMIAGGSNQYAKLLTNPRNETGVLETITLCVEQPYKDQKFNAVLLLHIYTNDSGMPGKDILEKNVAMQLSKREKKINLNLTSLEITFPPEGFFIGIDFIGYYNEQGAFIPYGRKNSPVKIYVQFTDAKTSDTFEKFFGTSWSTVDLVSRDGRRTPLAAKFGITVSY